MVTQLLEVSIIRNLGVLNLIVWTENNIQDNTGQEIYWINKTGKRETRKLIKKT